MRRSLIEVLSIRDKGLRENLTIISTLIFLFPSITVAYILFNTKTTVQFDITHIIMFVLTLFLVLMGMIILRQVFDEIIGVTTDLKRAGQGEKVVIDLNKTTSELHEISCSFNRLMEKMEINNELLEKQTEKLNREINGRRLAEEALSEKMKHLDQLAHHDTLTGLMNRKMFNDHLKRLVASSRRHRQLLAVMLLDLDHFKSINDTLGHSAGDTVLQEIAKRVKNACLRETDIVARLGGDEFVLILPDINTSEGSSMIARKIIEAMKSPIGCGDHELYVTASIGIALFPDDGQDEHSLLKNADTAMYKAKESGRNNFKHYMSSMNHWAHEHLSLGNDLHKALQQNEFLINYQPQIDLNNGRAIGAEALIRWRHPTKGILFPGSFISLAEKTGVIIPMGEWLLQRVCEQIRAWSELRLPRIRFSINLSARQFMQQNLVETIDRETRNSQIDPALVEIEITESIIMQDLESAIRIMHRLSSLGVSISVDDFGTGYSSLSYLKKFPISTLKIDKMFIDDLTTDSDDAAIVKAIIAMAHSLKMKVIAEGVETREQLKFLRSLECDAIQGNVFSRPVPAKELAMLLADEAT